MNQWFEYKTRKKLHRRLARAAAVAIRSVRSGRQALGFGPGRACESPTCGVRTRHYDVMATRTRDPQS